MRRFVFYPIVLLLAAGVFLACGCESTKPAVPAARVASALAPTSSPSTQPVRVWPTTRRLAPTTVPVLYVTKGAEGFEGSVGLWMVPFRERFGDNIVIVAGHGNSKLGTWVVQVGNGLTIPVDWIVRDVQADWPGKTIVLLICNPQHGKLDPSLSGVGYGSNSIWLVPDWVITPEERLDRTLTNGAAIGRVEDMSYVLPATRPSK